MWLRNDPLLSKYRLAPTSPSVGVPVHGTSSFKSSSRGAAEQSSSREEKKKDSQPGWIMQWSLLADNASDDPLTLFPNPISSSVRSFPKKDVKGNQKKNRFISRRGTTPPPDRQNMCSLVGGISNHSCGHACVTTDAAVVPVGWVNVCPVSCVLCPVSILSQPGPQHEGYPREFTVV
jgi:hypothetical protein